MGANSEYPIIPILKYLFRSLLLYGLQRVTTQDLYTWRRSNDFSNGTKERIVGARVAWILILNLEEKLL
jgi:hypothetical protein